MSLNAVELIGRVISAAMPHHEAYGRTFYALKLVVKRLSGNEDVLPIITDARDALNFEEGTYARMIGELRSYTLVTDCKRHLNVIAFSHTVERMDAQEDKNVLSLEGRLLHAPIYRLTPQGREIADMLLMVERTRAKLDALPLIAWGRNARSAQALLAGQTIGVEGRFQSREYRKELETGGAETRVAYEVSVGRLRA